ncbi:MAG: LysM peptidoglycan-binding domain-containing protein [Tissierellia bacterium]|nr:LysM peptidoglycan-binding domain-containing protein [Tissierellia bacterium]
MRLSNKRIFSLMLSLVLVLGLVFGTWSTVFAEEAVTLTIVHVNDVHGRANAKDGGMGYGKFKALVDQLRAEKENLLLLDAGDAFHGTLDINMSEGEAMIQLMNLLEFDAMTPGNHDFNYGYERLLELRDMAKFPILGSNIVKEADGTSDFEAYTIVEFEGFKVGIFGLTTEETKYKSHPKNTEGIKFESPVEVAKEMVKELKEKEVDIIIALVHLGIEGTTETTSKAVAENVEGIDIIVDGHSHEELNLLIGDTLLVQAGSYLENVGVVELEIKDGKVANKEAKLVKMDELEELTPVAEIEEELVKIEEKGQLVRATVVGTTKVDLDGERANVRTGETNLGNLITDAMRKSTGADIAFTNGGGIRASIPAGEVKIGDILTSFPFTNTLAVIEVTGEEILAALEHGVDLYPEQAGHFPHVSGMTYKFDPNKAVGERIVEVLVGGQPLVLDKKYTLVTNDFMASGGDGYTMFANKPFIAEGALLSDVLIEYFKEYKEVEPKVEGRIVVYEPAPEPQKYVVVPGDVLWKIARKFNTTWEVLAEFNKLKNPHLIFPGQVILIP